MAEQISDQERALQQIADTLESFPVCHMVLSLEGAAKTIRAQAKEIERMKARGVTDEEIREWYRSVVYGNGEVSLSHIIQWIASKGLLIEDAPKQERIYGVDVPPADQIPQYEIKRAEADPLKVDLNPALPPATLFAKIGSAHNVLVDALRALEQRIESTERATEKAWPRLPITIVPSVYNELMRIRTALGVKEVE